MTLSEMITIVRRDLHDEDSSNYRWTDTELTRHIAHALKDFSEALPFEQKATIATVSGSRELDISGLADRIKLEAVEYPAGNFPPRYQRFACWNNILTILGTEVPDGSNCYIYYGKLHTLDGSSSTIPTRHEDLVATGAEGYAAIEWGAHAINRVNVGGTGTPGELLEWGKEKLRHFRSELKRLGRRNRVRTGTLYTPYNPVQSQTADWGPE